MEGITAQQKTDLGLLAKTIAKNLAKLLIAGFFIGTFYANDGWVALVLGIYLIYAVSKKWVKNDPDKKIYLIGALISGFLGVCCEWWGIYNSFWQYHELGNNREFPFWLPMAWALAFTYIYKLEKDLFYSLGNPILKTKIILALLVAMVFPTLGEIITINMGVWTYSWPYQIYGVPVLAIILLMVFHSGVNLLMSWICYKKGWKNIVFNT